MVRHGEKAFMSGPQGPVLTPSGEKQAEAFARLWLPRVQGKNCGLYISEKIRTRQTLAPLATNLGVALQTDARLNERSHAETEAEFYRRVLQCLLQIESQQPPKDFVFFCSHYDVLETGVQVLEDKASSPFPKPYWRPTTFAHFLFSDGQWQWLATGDTP